MYIDNSDQEIIYFQIDSPFGQQMIVFINNAVINNIRRDRGNDFVTVSYDAGSGPRRRREELVLVVGRNTRIQDSRGRQMNSNQLRQGMRIDAVVSAAMTRSLPPQAQAFLIIVNDRRRDNLFAEGRITDINHRRNVFEIVEGRRGRDDRGRGRDDDGRDDRGRGRDDDGRRPDDSDDRSRNRIRFVVDQNTRFLNRNGREIQFRNLRQDDRVRVEYQTFNEPRRGTVNIALVVQML